jgi:hypothetical protein
MEHAVRRAQRDAARVREALRDGLRDDAREGAARRIVLEHGGGTCESRARRAGGGREQDQRGQQQREGALHVLGGRVSVPFYNERVKKRAIWRAGVCLCLVLLLQLGGCRSIPGSRTVGNLVTGRGVGSGRITQQELRQALVQFASRFEATVVAAPTRSRSTQDPGTQRRALRWKLARCRS